MVKSVLISNSFTKENYTHGESYTHIHKKYVYVCIEQMGFLSSIYPNKIFKRKSEYRP